VNAKKCHISVIVPVHNCERFLKACIQGLLAQRYPEDAFEIIMVDNNSTDDSVNIIKHNRRIKLLMEHKQGSYAARNLGLAKAEGSIIAFTDADCIPDSSWLDHIADAMRHPQTHILLGECSFAADSPMLSLLADYESEKACYICSRNDKSIYYGYTNNMAVRKEVFDRLGPFMEIVRGADAVFVRRALDIYNCSAVRYAPKQRVLHLEIGSIMDYYRKRYIYGKSSAGYQKLTSVRPLCIMERLQVLKTVRQKKGYSLTKGALLFLILIVGALYYELGRRRG
jgi:glycosyltransferase involved in cell wall biosynthesis